MISYIKKIRDFIISPFSQEFSFYSFLLFLISFVCCINRAYFVSLREAIAWLVVAGIMCYLVCLPLYLIRVNKWNVIYKWILVILGLTSSLIDLGLSFITSAFFLHYVTILLGTNPSEVVGFFKNFFNFQILFAIISFLLIIYLAWRCSKLLKSNKFIICLAIISLLVGTYLVRIGGTYIAKNIFIGKIYATIERYIEENKNLRDFYTLPQISKKQSLPQNIVIIIGESLQKDFCSLYGYEKCTNPLLSKLKDNLFVFTNISSPDVATVPCLQNILSTFSSHEFNKKWYECIPLPDILSNLGYQTYWISNQAQAGLFDNVVVKYANLCDSTLFVGTHFGMSAKTSYGAFDEVVLKPLDNLLKKDTIKRAFFVHLMGSHYAYEDRYPNKRLHFVPSDYSKYPEHQRLKRAHYDNSIIYNDSVVYQIFDRFEKMESIGFYFSDHGQDIYETDSNYAGHGRYADPESERIGKRIPFIIYTSPLYKYKYARELDLIKRNTNVQFNTEDFIYSLMDILDTSFPDNEDVKKYSLFKNR